MTLMPETATIDEQITGIPGVALGGYVCGLLARFLPGPVRVTLRALPPVARPLFVAKGDGDRLALLDGDTLIAEAVPIAFDIEVPPPISLEDARTASAAYVGFHQHPYPTCFNCGPERTVGTGLRIFPGPIHDEGPVAGPWHPNGSQVGTDGMVRPEFVWAALDCPSYWGLLARFGNLGSVTTGRIEAAVEAPVDGEEPSVVTGWGVAVEGRKLIGGSAVRSASGELKAWARVTWIRIDLSSS